MNDWGLALQIMEEQDEDNYYILREILERHRYNYNLELYGIQDCDDSISMKAWSFLDQFQEACASMDQMMSMFAVNGPDEE